MDDLAVMWLKQRHKSPMTGNGHHATYKKLVIWDLVYGIVFVGVPAVIIHL